MTKGSSVSFLNEMIDDAGTEPETFDVCAELQYLGNLIWVINICLDDQTARIDEKERVERTGEGTDIPVQEVDRNTVRSDYVRGSTDESFASVGGEYHGRCHGGLEEGVEVGERLDVEHVNLVDEDDTWNDLCDALINIAFDDFVDLSSQFISDFCPATFDKAAHYAHNILATLWSSVCGVKIAEGDILNEFLALVNIAFGQRDIGFGLEII